MLACLLWVWPAELLQQSIDCLVMAFCQGMVPLQKTLQ
jgi:hypothetical protein